MTYDSVTTRDSYGNPHYAALPRVRDDEPEPRRLTYRDGQRFWDEWEAGLAALHASIAQGVIDPNSTDGMY